MGEAGPSVDPDCIRMHRGGAGRRERMPIRTHSECRTEMMVWKQNLKKDSPPQCSFPSHYEILNVQSIRNAGLLFHLHEAVGAVD